jgi:hypothetical protein
MISKTLARAASIFTLGALLAAPGAAYAHNGVDHSAGATHEVVASPDSDDTKKAEKKKSKKATKNKQGKKSGKAKSSKGKSKGKKK